jgi:hypothetical protein
MVDLVITPANVVKSADAKVETGILGAAGNAGQTVYKDPLDSNRFKLADANSATSAARNPRGVLLNGGAVNQPAAVQYEGRITIGAAVVPGTIYVQSDTPGGIMPAADLSAGEFVTVLGVAVSTTDIELAIKSYNVAP